MGGIKSLVLGRDVDRSHTTRTKDAAAAGAFCWNCYFGRGGRRQQEEQSGACARTNSRVLTAFVIAVGIAVYLLMSPSSRRELIDEEPLLTREGEVDACRGLGLGCTRRCWRQRTKSVGGRLYRTAVRIAEFFGKGNGPG
uniref:Uncharacterized protein n=1 Tax=Solanum tuberosum TaxID=4113 RepID=M1B3F6_SOLTU